MAMDYLCDSMLREDAALTGTHHPAMQLLYISLTNMTSVPEGLLSLDFPPSLYDIELCGTNLTSLPADLHEKWPSVAHFLLELSPGIVEVPPTFMSPSCDWLSLSGNGITEVPDALFADFHFYQLFLQDNPLQTLPANLGDLSGATLMHVSRTDVLELPPSWRNRTSEAMVHLVASETPLCQAWLETQHLQATPSELTLFFDSGIFEVHCDAANAQSYQYPLSLEMHWRGFTK